MSGGQGGIHYSSWIRWIMNVILKRKGAVMKISDDHLKSVCRFGTKECCAYLSLGGDGWQCLRVQPSLKKIIDDRLKEGSMNAVCDNCDGPDTPTRKLN